MDWCYYEEQINIFGSTFVAIFIATNDIIFYANSNMVINPIPQHILSNINLYLLCYLIL